MCNPRSIADEIIINYKYDSGPQSLLKIIESLLMCKGKSEIQAFEYASEILFAVRDEISKVLENNRKNAVFSKCELIGDNFCTIIGSAYRRPTDTENKIKFRESSRFFNDILDCLCTLGSRDFEFFCKKLLIHLGASTSINTKPTRDEGIDFLARIPLPNSFASTDISGFEEAFSFLVFGQAKRYSKGTKVGTPEIRELIGSSIIMRYQELINSNDTLLSTELGNVKLCDPIQCIFLTTGQFSTSAQELADKTGVVLKDGSQLATYIAMQRIGFENELMFKRDNFLKWVRS